MAETNQSAKVARQFTYCIASVGLGMIGALVGGGWIIFAPTLNPALLKPGTTTGDFVMPCLMLWLACALMIRGLIYLLVERFRVA